MSQDSGDFVGVVAILVIFGLPLGYAIVNRFYAHQERMEMLRRGMAPPPDPRWFKRAARSDWQGMAAPGPVPPGFPPAYEPYGYSEYQGGRCLRKGITLVCIGIALYVGLSIGLGPNGPWVLGGLIPLFVGIAQIIIALLSGARFGALGMPGPGPAAQPGHDYQQPPFSAERNATPGPYAWRPGPTTELEKPPSPPEPRS